MVEVVAVESAVGVLVKDTPVLLQDEAPGRRSHLGLAFPDVGQFFDSRRAFSRRQLLELRQGGVKSLRRKGVVCAVGAAGVPILEARREHFPAGRQDLAKPPLQRHQRDELLVDQLHGRVVHVLEGADLHGDARFQPYPQVTPALWTPYASTGLPSLAALTAASQGSRSQDRKSTRLNSSHL